MLEMTVLIPSYFRKHKNAGNVEQPNITHVPTTFWTPAMNNESNGRHTLTNCQTASLVQLLLCKLWVEFQHKMQQKMQFSIIMVNKKHLTRTNQLGLV